MKFRRVITAVISLIFVAAVALCSFSGPVEKGPVYAPLRGPLKITLSSGTYPADTAELSLPVTAEDFKLMHYFTELKSVDFSGSSLYEEINAWSEANPQVHVTFTMSFPTGFQTDNHAEKLDLSGLKSKDIPTVITLMSYMHDVKSIELGSASPEASLSGDEIYALQQAAPEAELSYCIELLGSPVDLNVESLDLSTLSHSDVESVCATLKCLPKLKNLSLGSDEKNDLSFDDIVLIQDSCPETAELDYSYSLWGKSFSINDDTMNFSHIAMDDNGASVRSALKIMRKCTFLDMDTCGVSNEDMAQIRADFPNVQVVWRVWFGEAYSVRTNAERILASKPSKGGTLDDNQVRVLRYCDGAKYVDIGHNEVVTDISFVEGMPNLEVLILAMNQISDISPLASCPKLEYIELNSTPVSDLSPLSGLTELRHLNIGNCLNVSDISPLFGLKDLERLWIGARDPVPAEQVEIMKQNAPDCEIDTTVTNDPTGGNWRFVDLNDSGWASWEEYGYFTFDNHPRYDLLREQFGYDDGLAAYAFYWNDPLY